MTKRIFVPVLLTILTGNHLLAMDKKELDFWGEKKDWKTFGLAADQLPENQIAQIEHPEIRTLFESLEGNPKIGAFNRALYSQNIMPGDINISIAYGSLVHRLVWKITEASQQIKQSLEDIDSIKNNVKEWDEEIKALSKKGKKELEKRLKEKLTPHETKLAQCRKNMLCYRGMFESLLSRGPKLQLDLMIQDNEGRIASHLLSYHAQFHPLLVNMHRALTSLENKSFDKQQEMVSQGKIWEDLHKDVV